MNTETLTFTFGVKDTTRPLSQLIEAARAIDPQYDGTVCTLQPNQPSQSIPPGHFGNEQEESRLTEEVISPILDQVAAVEPSAPPATVGTAPQSPTSVSSAPPRPRTDIAADEFRAWLAPYGARLTAEVVLLAVEATVAES